MNQNLPFEVLRQLRAQGKTLATAESCTGGLIAKSITDIPGSSAMFFGACVTYTNEIKAKLLGVDPEIFERESEVSVACAEAMALGARERLGTTYALSTTGYAGPGGGTDEKPVGLVYIGIALKNSDSKAIKNIFKGDRDEVRTSTVCKALELVLEALR